MLNMNNSALVKLYVAVYLYLQCIIFGKGFVLPESCEAGQYYDPGAFMCQACPANVSMIASADGFGCTCEKHSVPAGINRCRPCNATDIISIDGRACVPRRCQSSVGRVVCRKCPGDYISVTQNLDGSPTKEVLCVKCARGYKPENNVCVRCESCKCARHEIIVRGTCVPKRYVTERPKYSEATMHPFALLDIVKHEYLCTQNDLRACRTLANECVRNFYTTHLAGPCRLWVQTKIVQPQGLPQLTIENENDKTPEEIVLSRGMRNFNVVVAVFTSDGGMRILQDLSQRDLPCLLPLNIVVGNDYSKDCHINVTKLEPYLNETFAPFLYVNGEFKAVPVTLKTPAGHHVQRGTWASGKFRRFFLIDNVLSITTNTSSTVYLRTLLIHLRIQKDNIKSGLRVHYSIEAQYATKSLFSTTVTSSLRVEHELPSAGVLRGLEIWGGVLGALLSLYAVVQWRGVVRRGGLYISLTPLLAGSVADALYFAAWFSALHALAAEAGTLGITLPLSRSEEQVIRACVYSGIALKTLRVAWTNWNQCRCDIFFLDWSEYNPPSKGATIVEKCNNWRAPTLAREWNRMQTRRRASPGFTVTLALVILHFMTPWLSYLPPSRGYRWAVATLAWWSGYTTVLSAQWLLDKVLGPPTAILSKVCNGVGLSMLVFQEEYYAHYVHGRNDDSETRSMAGPLAMCRVICTPQLRAVYKQLSTSGPGSLGDSETRRALLSRFMAAFFERALDGLSWVASERSVIERLLDVEVNLRETGTSALLYDPDDNTPSCFVLTWWGEEWSLGTFDAMLFGCIVIAIQDFQLAALVTIVVWQIMKNTRSWFGNKNLKEKIEIESH